jgi:hypothetical protein
VIRTRAPTLKFLLAALGGASLAVAALHARAAGDEDAIRLTVASSQGTTLAWVGAMHTFVVPEVDRRLAL